MQGRSGILPTQKVSTSSCPGAQSPSTPTSVPLSSETRVELAVQVELPEESDESASQCLLAEIHKTDVDAKTAFKPGMLEADSVHRVSEIEQLLDLHLGFDADDAWKRIASAQSRAQRLFESGRSVVEIKADLTQHNDWIHNIQVGDVIRSLDVACWYMRTGNGNLLATNSNTATVVQVVDKRDGCVIIEDVTGLNYGEVRLCDYMFEIEGLDFLS